METVTELETKIDCLDKGYVRYCYHGGDDLAPVNAARVSFEKEATEFTQADARLLSFLAREGHTSPLRHAYITFEFRAPLMVARQHWKYVVGSDHTMDGWNEASRRYVTDKTQFYIPKADEWRSAPDNKKQGSGAPIDTFTGAMLFQKLMEHCEASENLYEWAMSLNVAPEQARLFLNAYALYVTYRWSGSLQSVIHFLNQRLADDAQREIQTYAAGVYRLLEPRFPITVQTFVGAGL